MANDLQNFIGGQWTDLSYDKRADLIDPSTGEVFATAPISGPEEVDYFIQALDDVMADAHRGSGLTLEFGRTMARGAMRRKSERSIATSRPVLGPAADVSRGA